MITNDPEWMSDKTILQTIGSKIRTWRLSQNMSRARLALLSELSLSTVAGLESGKGISLSGLTKILRVLGKLDALIPFLEDEPISPIEYEKFIEGKKQRRRASKSKSTDSDSPIWNPDRDMWRQTLE